VPNFTTDPISTDSTLTVGGVTTLNGAVAVAGALTTTGEVDLSGSTVILPAAAVQYAIRTYELTILFSELGSGASDAFPLEGFPTNVYVLGGGILINTAFAGEADFSAIIGDTNDDNGLMTVTVLNGVAAGTFLAANGAETGFRFEADFAGAGGDVTFTATELNDVSAGSCTIRVFYIDPNP
jgi:hypothetical protein